MQEFNGLSGDIKNILDSIAEEEKNKKEASVLPDAKPKKAGLEFDDSDEEEIIETGVFFEEKQEKKEERPKEFSVPEKFEQPSEPSNSNSQFNGPRVYSTYVPTFTGAGDNYRMANDPRPPLKLKKEVHKSETEEEKDAKIDPTAELDEDINLDSVKVNEISSSQEDSAASESASTVFKFADDTEEKSEETAVQNSSPLPAEEKSQPEETERPDNERRNYVIPDPVSEPSSLAPYSYKESFSAKKIIEKTPSDIGDKDNFVNINRRLEYKSLSERDSFKDKFLDAIMSIKVRFWVAVVISLILIVAESLYTFGVDIPKLLNVATVPGAMALLDMQFILGLYLISLPETVLAFKKLMFKKVCPELSITLSFAISIAYTAVIAVYSPRSYPLFGLLFAIPVIAAIGASYFKKSADFEAFKTVSVSGPKSAIDKKYTRTLEYENSALDGVVEEHKSKISRVFSAEFISNFFERVEYCSENSKSTILSLGVSFGAAVVIGAISFFVPGGAVSALSSFAMVFMLAFPAISIMSKKLPYYHSEKEALVERSAVIGEASLIDYSGVDVITFEDSDVFGAEDVTIQRIMLYGRSDNLTKALRQMSALFMNVGGPLDRLFSDSLDRKCHPADSTVIEKNGIKGEIASHKVLAGTLDYMRQNSVAFPEEENEKQETLSGSTKVIYAAEDGAVYAKFYVRYSFSEEFSMLLPTLYDEGIKLLIYTRDPNITNELIKNLTPGVDKIRVMRKYNNAEDECVTYKEISSGLVTLGEKNNSINMILLSKKYARLQARLGVTELIAMIVGASLATLISFAGLWLVPSLALALWQSAWCGVLHFISAKSFKRLKK